MKYILEVADNKTEITLTQRESNQVRKGLTAQSGRMGPDLLKR